MGTFLKIAPQYRDVEFNTLLVDKTATINGDLTLNGTINVSGSIYGTSSYATSASYALFSTSASWAPSNLNGGTTNFIPLWTSATSLSSSAIYQSGSSIGVGTKLPTALLHISGSTSGSEFSLKVLNSSGETLISAQNNKTVNINSTNLSSGNTNIGTTSGTITFNQGFNNTLAGNSFTFYAGGAQSTIIGYGLANPGITVGYAAGTGNSNIGTTFSVKGATATTSSFALRVLNSNQSQSLNVRNDGMIIVGSGSYSYGTTYGTGGKLTIANTSGYNGLVISNGVADNSYALSINTTTSDGVGVKFFWYDGNNAPFLQQSNNLGSILGLSTGATTTTVQGGAVYFKTATTERARFAVTTGNFLIGSATEAGYKLLVSGSGISGSLNVNNILYVSGSNIGIGNIIPSYKLDVSGSIRGTSDALINGLTVGKGGGNISSNTAVGSGSLFVNTTGTDNLAFGLNSLRLNTDGYANTSIGSYSLYSNTSGQSNIAIGPLALFYNTLGSSNTAIGNGALLNNIIGGSNVAIGDSALTNKTIGSNNTAIGFAAGAFIFDGFTSNVTSSDSIFIGCNAKASASGQVNQIVIGHEEIGLGDNTTIIGNSLTYTTAIRGNLLLGTTTDEGYKLNASGSSKFGGSIHYPIQTVIANYALTVDDYTVISDVTSNAVRIDLPEPASCVGRIYNIKQMGGGTYSTTVEPSTFLIDGHGSIVLSCDSSITLQSDGVGWYILSLYNDASCL